MHSWWNDLFCWWKVRIILCASFFCWCKLILLIFKITFSDFEIPKEIVDFLQIKVLLAEMDYARVLVLPIPICEQNKNKETDFLTSAGECSILAESPFWSSYRVYCQCIYWKTFWFLSDFQEKLIFQKKCVSSIQ